MKLLDKRVVIPHGNKRAPIIAFATYTHATKPHLLRRHGWEIADDIHDDVFDISSTDNGATWSKPEIVLKNFQSDRGTVVHIESCALYLPDRDRLVIATNRSFQPDTAHGHQMGHPVELRITVSKPDDYRTAEPLITDFGLPNGLAISFCQPIAHSNGRVIMPVQVQTPDPDGTLRKLGIPFDEKMGLTLDYGTSRMLIGEFRDEDHIDWHLGDGVPIEPGLSSRGTYEPTLIERADGSLVAVLRGSNKFAPDKPGYKWMSISRDAGETWSSAEPLPCDDGSFIESSSTGSLLLRSRTDGQVYWIGNLCIDGVRPNNNMPRSPIVIARVQEEPFALIRDSIFVIDRAQPHEHPETQHSNFKAYQDRETGDVVLYLVRYGERGYPDNAWLNADHYQYRVQLHD